jgi:N-acetylglucosamine-6-phosphate deacetylase
MATLTFRGGTVILEDRLLAGAEVEVAAGRISAIHPTPSSGASAIDLDGGYLAPGFVDLHVHGGDNSDFMDGTPEAFRAACRAHARHGTTSLLPTCTVASHEQHLTFLALCRKFKHEDTGGARVLGAHFYGPYFAYEARGAHPAAGIRPPVPAEYEQYLAFADSIVTATVAPELPGAVQHIDHVFCAMSDRARLRQSQTYPMRGGVLEATLYFDELTTEIIADGKHLCRELLLLAYKCKGPDRLALVSDCNRALDMPDGPYLIGPLDGGEPMIKSNGVGLLPSGAALASSVVGVDHCVRTFHQLTGVPLEVVVRMASLTPARIAGFDRELGSIAVGKRADLLILDRELSVRAVYCDGHRIWVADS